MCVRVHVFGLNNVWDFWRDGPWREGEWVDERWRSEVGGESRVEWAERRRLWMEMGNGRRGVNERENRRDAMKREGRCSVKLMEEMVVRMGFRFRPCRVGVYKV